MIAVHVLDYLILIIVSIVTLYIPYKEVRATKISIICSITIVFVCNVIFGLIIYRLASNIMAVTAPT